MNSLREYNRKSSLSVLRISAPRTSFILYTAICSARFISRLRSARWANFCKTLLKDATTYFSDPSFRDDLCETPQEDAEIHSSCYSYDPLRSFDFKWSLSFTYSRKRVSGSSLNLNLSSLSLFPTSFPHPLINSFHSLQLKSWLFPCSHAERGN